MGSRRGDVLGLDVEDVDEDKLDGDPASVDAVQLPLAALPDAVDGDGVDVVVDDEGDVDSNVHDHHALCTQLERQDLDGVGDEQTRPRERVADTMEPEEDDDSNTGASVAGLAVLRTSDSCSHETQKHTSGGCKEEWPATDAVTEQGARNGHDQRENLVTAVKSETLLGATDTSGFVDLVGVVGEESVARPLREQTKRNDEHKSVPVSLGPDEVRERRALLGEELEANGLLDLLELELDQRVVNVAISVVLAEHLKRVLGPLLRQQPTRRLGNPEDEHELDDRGKSLDESGDSPRPTVVHVLCAERDP